MKFSKIGSVTLALLLVFTILAAGCRKTTGESNDGNNSSDISINISDIESGDNWSEDVSGDASGDASNTGSSNSASGNGNGGNTATAGGNSASGNQGGTGLVVQASFTRNADGTCTDRETGVVFLDDDLNDWKKTFERGEDLKFDTSSADFLGDSSRVVKTDANATDSWFTYKLDAGVTEVGVVVISEAVNGKVLENFTVSVSKDNKTWTVVSSKKDGDVYLGSNWYTSTYRYTGIDKANKYVKITYKKAVSDEDHTYNPNISRLRINNISKMDDPDRFLEDRASATFYVDSVSGNDKNDGTSEATAFKSLAKVSSKYYQPGDKILFKSGCTFSGSVEINGYGTAENRVTIGSYGSGDKPKISARGGTAVTVKCDYVTIENLEVTNPNGLKGIYVGPAHTGANKGIIIQNNYVHDVQTSASDFVYSNAGISAGTGGLAPTWYEGMVVQGNTVKNTARTGIYFTTSWADRYGFGWGQSASLYKSDTDGWWPYENLLISNNTVDSPQGDGILVIGARNTVIEHNTVLNAFAATRSFQSQTACAALWTINTNNTVVQYNNVGYTRLPISQNGADGEGYDIDCAENGTIVQYNYSHNNEGGFILLCDTEDGYKNVSKNNIVRFNLSVNDATRKNGQGVFMATNTQANTDIYNNTIVAANDTRNLFYSFGKTVMNISFKNNIFYGNAKFGGTVALSNCVFENNILANGAKAPAITGLTVSGNKEIDPMFKNAGATDYQNRANMIAAFTPQNKMTGASTIANNGGKDINGSSISSAFYGAVKY